MRNNFKSQDTELSQISHFISNKNGAYVSEASLQTVPDLCASHQNLAGTLPADPDSADNAIRSPIFCRTSPSPPKQILKDKVLSSKRRGKPGLIRWKKIIPQAELVRQSGGIGYLRFQQENRGKE